jgi:hypothetical protein
MRSQAESIPACCFFTVDLPGGSLAGLLAVIEHAVRRLLGTEERSILLASCRRLLKGSPEGLLKGSPEGAGAANVLGCVSGSM